MSLQKECGRLMKRAINFSRGKGQTGRNEEQPVAYWENPQGGWSSLFDKYRSASKTLFEKKNCFFKATR